MQSNQKKTEVKIAVEVIDHLRMMNKTKWVQQINFTLFTINITPRMQKK